MAPDSIHYVQRFHGAQNVNYSSMAASSGLTFHSGDYITVSIWAKNASLSFGMLFDFGGWNHQGIGLLMTTRTGDRVYFHFGNGGYEECDVPTPLDTTAWHLYSFVVHPDRAVVDPYIDGAAVPFTYYNFGGAGSTATFTSSTPLVIGAYSGGTGIAPFNGDIGTMKVWSGSTLKNVSDFLSQFNSDKSIYGV